MQMKRTNMWVQVGKEQAGGIKRVALTYIHYHESNRELVRRCSLAQGAQPNALGRPRWAGWRWDGRKVQGEGGICIHITDFIHCAAETGLPWWLSW